MTRTIPAALLMLVGCQALNVPDPTHEDVRTAVYRYDLPEPQPAATEPANPPEPIDDGTAFKGLRNAMGLP